MIDAAVLLQFVDALEAILELGRAVQIIINDLVGIGGTIIVARQGIIVVLVQLHLQLGAVGDGDRLQIVAGATLVGIRIAAGDIVHIVQRSGGVAVNSQSIALGGQVNHILLVEVHVLASGEAGELSGVFILGAVNSDAAVLDTNGRTLIAIGTIVGEGLNSLGGRGSTGHRLDDIAADDGVILAQSHSQDSALGVLISVEAIEDLLVVVVIVIVIGVAQVVAVDIHQGDLNGSALVLQGVGQLVVHGIDLGIGVRTDHDGIHIVIVVLIGVNDVALTGNVGVGSQILVLAQLLAVEVHDGIFENVIRVQIHVVAVSDQLLQSLVGILDGVGVVNIVGVSADILAVIDPLGGGSTEIIGVVLSLQVAEVLLAELLRAAGILLIGGLVVAGVVLAGGTLHLSGGGLVGDGDVAHGDSAVVLVLHHGGLQGVEGVQAGLFTSHSGGADEVVVAVVQLDAQSALANGDGPVGAGVALDVAVIAQGAQQHLHEGIAGQSSGGTEGTVSITGDDAFLLAVRNVASEGVGGRNVAVGSGVSAQSAGGGGAQDQVADDLGGSATGQGVLGIESAVFVALNNAQSGHHVNSFFVLDLAVVREVLGTGRDSDQRHGHRQSQNQRKELLHGIFSSF